jgi:phosphatidylglycerophosphate synthase
MLDGLARRLIDPPLDRLARSAVAIGIGADTVTALALCAGLAAAAAIAAAQFGAALVLIGLSRLGDGLDGAIARATSPTDRGGMLDIVADFVFYGAIPLAFAFHDPAGNALPAAVLLFSFYVNGATFLAYAAIAARRGMESSSRGVKTLYFTAGLAEGTETIGVFVLMVLFPAAFPILAGLFALICLVTAGSRMLLAWRDFT